MAQALLPPKVASSAVTCIFSPALHLLLVDVSDVMSSAELQHLPLDAAKLKAAGSYEELFSVVVTCWNEGAPPYLLLIDISGVVSRAGLILPS